MPLRAISNPKISACECSRGTHQKPSLRTIRHFSTKNPSRKIFEDEAIRKKIELQDWYKVDIKTLDKKTSELLQSEFNGSLHRALSTLFPERDWNPWKFQQDGKRAPRGYWKELPNQRKFFDDLGKKVGIQTLDDWYHKLSMDIVLENSSRILRQHGQSPSTALMAAYPEHNWLPWKFNTLPKGYLLSPSNQRKFFDWLGHELGVNQLDDWYEKLSSDALIKNGGYVLMRHHKGTITALMATYPEHKWYPWKFHSVVQGYWKDVSNVRLFFDWLGKELGVQTLDDWYEKLSIDVVVKNGGGGMLSNQYNGSATAGLVAAYPEHNWIPWKFRVVPMRYWKDPANQKLFLDDLGKKIGIQTLDDWYQKASVDVFHQNGGSGLLAQFKNSPAFTLMAVYPAHNWIPWKFNVAMRGTWGSKENIKQVLEEVSEKLSIQTLDDWYRVDRTQLNMAGATSIVQRYKGLYNVLKEQYPYHPWDPKRFKQIGRKGQRWLAVTLKKMFPGEEILEDYLHPKAVFPSSNRWMQLDVFIPSRSLAFEYQGQQHYEEIGIFGATRTHKQRDEEKRVLCAANDIKLIEVPYWWNRTQESLQEMIAKAQ